MSHRSSIAILIAMVVVRLALMLAVLKFLSSTFGPERFGTLSQIMGVGAIFYMFAGGGVTNGLVKHVAAAVTSTERFGWLSAAGAIAIASSAGLALIAVMLFFFGAGPIFADAGLAPVFLVIGIAQIFVGAGNLALAYLSGLGDLKRFAFANAAGNLAALALVLALTAFAGFSGAAIAAALLPLGPALLGIAFLLASFRGDFAFVRPERHRIVQLLKFSGVMIVAVTAVPLAQLYIRADLGQSIGWEAVGYWQAVARISDAYMQIVGVLLINYYLPQLSKAANSARLSIMKLHGGSLLAMFVVGAAVFWLLRDMVIRTAFSAEFLPATKFVEAQLAGDLFKIIACLFIYYFVAVGRIWVQSVAELLQGVGFVLLFLLLKPAFGELAAVYAHAAACLAVLVLTGSLFLFSSLSPDRFR